MTTAGSVPGVRSSNFTNLFDAQIRSVSTNADSRLAQESPDPKNRIADPKNRIGGGARPGGSPLVGFAYKGQRRSTTWAICRLDSDAAYDAVGCRQAVWLVFRAPLSFGRTIPGARIFKGVDVESAGLLWRG